MLAAHDLHSKYRSCLRPIFEMLKHKKYELTLKEWLLFVRKTEQSILHAPNQYLADLPTKEILEMSIRNLFNEFLDELGVDRTS